MDAVSRPVGQMTATSGAFPVGMWSSRPRKASMTGVTGWCRAKPRIRAGMVTIEEGPRGGRGPVGLDLDAEAGLIRDRVPSLKAPQACVVGGAVAEEDPQALGADPGPELARGPFGDDRPAVDHRHPIGKLVGLFQVLGRHEHGDAAPRQALKDAPHGLPAGQVEPGGGLVQEDHGGLGNKAGGEVEPPE
jgi:hypothetical protein